MPIDIVLKEIPALRAAVIRCAQPDLDFYTMTPIVGPAFTELTKRLHDAHVRSVGPLFLFYEPVSEDILIPNVAVDVGDQPVPVDDLVTEVEPPAITAATTIHVVDQGTSGPCMPSSLDGLKIIVLGPRTRTGSADRPVQKRRNDFVTEHQLPMEKV